MTEQERLIKEILSVTDDAVNSFSSSIPAMQRQILDEVVLLVKDLDIDSKGTIKNNVANLRTIGKIKGALEKIVLNDDYLKDVKKFTDAFNEVAKLQNQYFNLIEKTFKPSKLLAEIQKQSINSAIESLTESGIGANVTDEIKDMLQRNITSGGSYSELQTQLRNSILSNKTGGGLLERYTKQVTTDSIQQFNAQYAHAVSDDLGLDWFMYVGSNIETTREFCEHLTKKKYVHRSEISVIVDGDIDGFHVKINPKTKLWYGAIPDTNENNFKINRGGFNCAHQLAPVSAAVIPKNIRAKFPD